MALAYQDITSILSGGQRNSLAVEELMICCFHAPGGSSQGVIPTWQLSRHLQRRPATTCARQPRSCRRVLYGITPLNLDGVTRSHRYSVYAAGITTQHIRGFGLPSVPHGLDEPQSPYREHGPSIPTAYPCPLLISSRTSNPRNYRTPEDSTSRAVSPSTYDAIMGRRETRI